MAFGFPAYFIESRVFNQRQDELSAILQSALNNLGWRYKLLSDNEFRANIAISFLSWGETLEIRIFSGGRVQVESKCIYPLQCFDWGKNKENVETFFAQVEKLQWKHSLTTNFEKTPSIINEPGMSPVERIINEENDK